MGLKTIGTFVVICSLWTLWSCQSWSELQVLAEAATNVSWVDALLIAGGLAVLGIAGVLWGVQTSESSSLTSTAKCPQGLALFWRSAAATTAGALSILAIALASRLFETSRATTLLATLRQDQMNSRDLDWQRRGYYEELDLVRANYRVWTGVLEAPADWTDPQLYRKRNDFLKQELVPSTRGVLCGTIASTNQWGMRDREYEKAKPPATYRIVLIGSSHEMGAGVKDDQTFENLVEDRLNQSLSKQTGVRYEILNMSLGGYGVLRELVRFERGAIEFAPDAAIFALNSGDCRFDLGELSLALRPGADIPYDFFHEVFARAGVDGELPGLVTIHRLQPHLPDVYIWAFKRIKEVSSQRGIQVWGLYRPAVIDPAGTERVRRSELLRSATKAGLEVIDLSSAFDHVEDRNSLVLAPWDDHSNAMGHKLLAERFYSELSQRLLARPEWKNQGSQIQK